MAIAKAEKLAKIGMLLRRQGEPDAVKHLEQSLMLNPTAATVWKTLGHWLAQDGKPEAAKNAFCSAANLAPPGEDAAARTGLATVLTQLGQPGAAAEEEWLDGSGSTRYTGLIACMKYLGQDRPDIQ